MVAAIRRMNEFKDEILARIDEKFRSLKTDILEEHKNQIKNWALSNSAPTLTHLQPPPSIQNNAPPTPTDPHPPPPTQHNAPNTLTHTHPLKIMPPPTYSNYSTLTQNNA